MKAISKSQRDLLVKLWEQGTFIHFMAGLNAHYFIHNSLETVNSRSVWALKRLGFLRMGKSDWRGSEWYLSETGKAIASQSTEGKGL